MNSNIYERIAIYCEKNELFQNGDGVIAGLSGGADSVFLLYALSKLQSRWNLRLHAVHINHGIRGKEALRDQEYSEAFAKSLGIPYTVCHGDIPALSASWQMTEEEAGRTFRYNCFEKIRSEKGFDLVAVAHHQEDQAETILFQMLRGSSLRGLGGMHPKRGTIVRPLLDIRRREIEEELARQKITYCMDSTNEQDIYARNLIRRHVIPYLQEKIQPAAVEHIAQSGMHLQEVMNYIEAQRDAVYNKIVYREKEKLSVECTDFQPLHPVMQREIILRMIEELAGRKKDITSAHIQSVCALFMGSTGKKLSLPYCLKAEKSYDNLMLYVEKESFERKCREEKEEISIEWNREYSLKGMKEKGLKVIFQKKSVENLSDNYLKKHCTKCFDYDRMVTMPIFRYPAKGDYLWLEKAGKKKKLSRLFIDEKIPASQRKDILVLAEGSHILWVPLLNRCSAYYYVTEDTKEIICATLYE